MAQRTVKSRRRNRTEQRRPDIGLVLTGSLEQRWAVVLAMLRATRRRCTEESIHDLRVAMRRLAATIDILRMVVPDQQLDQARRALRKHLKSFNELRDVHVQILTVSGMVRKFPILRPYLAELRRRERALVGHMRRRVGKIPVETIQRALAGATTRLLSLMTVPQARSVAESTVLGAMGSAFLRALDLRQQLTPGDVRSVHRLRVAFKKCRYTVEVLRPLLAGVGRHQLKAMNAYQTFMGDVQDLAVLGAGLNTFVLRRRPASPASYVGVQQELARRQKNAIDLFIATADELYGFWKSSLADSHGPLHSATRHRR